MISKRATGKTQKGCKPYVPNRAIVYASLMINSEYTYRAGMGQTGKSPEGIKNV